MPKRGISHTGIITMENLKSPISREAPKLNKGDVPTLHRLRVRPVQDAARNAARLFSSITTELQRILSVALTCYRETLRRGVSLLGFSPLDPIGPELFSYADFAFGQQL